MKLSVCMILGRCDEKLGDTLYSVSEIADEVCLVQTVDDKATTDIVKSFDFKVPLKYEIDPSLMHEDGFLRSFAEARQKSFDLATGDMVMWIDADDIIYQPEKLREAIEYWEKEGVDIIRMDYDYEFNEHGHCTTRHTRERVIRRGYCEWNKNAPIHEVLSPVRQCNYYDLSRNVSHIIHQNIKDADDSDRGVRNLTMLERIVREGGDQRMVMYYGKSLEEARRFPEALEQYQNYLDASTWDEEKYQIMLRMSGIYRRMKAFDIAKIMCFKAVEMIPKGNLAYIHLAEIAAIEQKWSDVIHWVNVFGQSEKLHDGMIHNPMSEEIQPLVLLQRAYMELGDFNRVVACTIQLREKMPQNSEEWDLIDSMCAKELRDAELIESYNSILKVTPEEDRQAIYDSIPDSIAKYPPFYRNRSKERPDGKKVLAIYCGYDETQAWGPESIKTGIGGSEEAVINVSKEFVKLGWHVEVYNNCTNEGLIDGVHWYQVAAANPDDIVDLCILWRHPHLVKAAPKGRQTWLWNHDLQNGMEPYYSEEIMDRIDKVMFLSEFHRTTAPWVPEAKVFITRNGVDPELMMDGENDPNTVIYASSPDRGLDTLLEMWPEVIKANPNAKLKVFYGFNKWFDQRYKNDPKMMKWKQDLLDYMENEPSVTYYGSVGQDVLAKHMASSGIWAYPTEFGEISCITAMKMQACGCVPVCTRYAALEETVQHGHKMGEYMEPVFDKKDFVEKLISIIGEKNHQEFVRKEMVPWARKEYRWDGVAKEWEQCYNWTPEVVDV